MKPHFNAILPYFSSNVTSRSSYCNFKCSHMLCSSIVIQITWIQLSTTSQLWDIQWKPYIDIFPGRPPCIYTFMTGRGGKLQQLHCYHPFSDSLDIYLTKSHYENYSPKMVPIVKIWGPGSWTSRTATKCNNHPPIKSIGHVISKIRYAFKQNSRRYIWMDS